MFKIQSNSSAALCATCRHGQIVERRTGHVLSYCHVGGDRRPIPGDVAKCSDFEDRRQIDKYELEKIAWRISHRQDGTIRGFTPPKKDEGI